MSAVPLILPSEVSGLPALHGFLKNGNDVVPMSFPYIELPKHILNATEAEIVIQQADITTAEGLRDRAILETFYSTAMRRMEVANLKLYDIDAERGTVMVRLGKGKKDRHIPIGERALAWIQNTFTKRAPSCWAQPMTELCS